MALIECKECGNMVSEKASACPKCGCPIGIPLTCPECGEPITSNAQFCDNCGCPVHKDVLGYPEREWLAEGTNKKRQWIWAVIGVLLCLVCGLGYWAYSRLIKGEAEPESKEKVSHFILVDGKYAFQGNWESSRYAAQSCKLEFEKKEGRLVDCAYTNLRYQSRIPLNGTIKDDSLHFVGDINGKQLVIDLIVASDGNSLIGEGIDHAHNGDKAKLNLTKTAVDNAGDEMAPSYDENYGRDEERTTQQKQREEEEPLQKESPAWLQGRWVGRDSKSGYTFEMIIEGSVLTQKVGGQVFYRGDWAYNGRDLLMYNRVSGGWNDVWTVDKDNQVLTLDGVPMRKENGSTSTSSSSSRSSYSYDGSSHSSHRFSSADDVIGWLSDKTFYNGNRRLRIRPNGVWLNDYCATFAPTVERYESWKALIRAMTATGERLSFLVNPIDGAIIDEAGDVFKLR